MGYVDIGASTPSRRGPSRGGRHPPALLHQPRRTGVRPGQPARGGEGRPLRPVLAFGQEPAPAVPGRVRRRPRHHRRPGRGRDRRAWPGPSSSTTGCSSSTATTRWPSSVASTWRASRPPTSSPRCSSGAGSCPTWRSPPATSPTTAAWPNGRYRYHRRPEHPGIAARGPVRRRHGPPLRRLRASCFR